MKKYIIKRFVLIAVSVGMFTTLYATRTKRPKLSINIPPSGNKGNTTETDDDSSESISDGSNSTSSSQALTLISQGWFANNIHPMMKLPKRGTKGYANLKKKLFKYILENQSKPNVNIFNNTNNNSSSSYPNQQPYPNENGYPNQFTNGTLYFKNPLGTPQDPSTYYNNNPQNRGSFPDVPKANASGNNNVYYSSTQGNSGNSIVTPNPLEDENNIKRIIILAVAFAFVLTVLAVVVLVVSVVIYLLTSQKPHNPRVLRKRK